MRLALTVFGHALVLEGNLHCPEPPEPPEQPEQRDSALDAYVETTGTHPDERAELDSRVRPELTFGFRQQQD